MLITYEALVKENALLAGKLRLDNSEQIKNCLGKNSKTFREIKHQQRERGRREEGRGGMKGEGERVEKRQGRRKGRKEGGREEEREGRRERERE